MNSLLILTAEINANFNRLHKKRGQMTNTHTLTAAHHSGSG